MQVVQGGIDAQTEQVFANIRSTLAHFGAGLGDVIKVTIFLTDMADLEAVSAIRCEAIPDPLPSSAIGVVALASPGDARRDRGDRRSCPAAGRLTDRPKPVLPADAVRLASAPTPATRPQEIRRR